MECFICLHRKGGHPGQAGVSASLQPAVALTRSELECQKGTSGSGEGELLMEEDMNPHNSTCGTSKSTKALIV